MTGYMQMWKFCEATGYTEKAVREKIQKGVWLQNRVWRKAPDGRILISMEGFRDWVEMGKESETPLVVRTKSPLPLDLRAPRPKSGKSPSPIGTQANRKKKDGQG
jgi:hypothetical protein